MKGDKLTFQVQFWALIGPFISLLAIFVFFVKGTTTPAYLPAVLLFGVPACWKWKLKGFGGALLSLFVILAYYYPDIPLDDRFWHLGMGVSIAISLLITALSFEEVEALLETMKVESRSRLENLWKVDEKLQMTDNELKKKREKIRELNVKVRSYQKLIDRSTEELVELRSAHEKTEHELYQTKSEKQRLEQSLAQALSDPYDEERYRQLQTQYEAQEEALEQALEELYKSNEELMLMQRENEELKETSDRELEEAIEGLIAQVEREKSEEEGDKLQELSTLEDVLSDLIELGNNSKSKMSK